MARILIVDDDPQLRQSFERLLLAEGHEVRTAARGDTAVDMVAAEAPDVAVMDVRMPGMNGLEAFARIHALEPKLPVIIMTAFAATDVAIEATKMGAFDYVLKPFDIPAMLDLIEKAVKAGRFMRSRVEMGEAAEAAETGGDGAEPLLGRSPAMQEVFKAIGRVATTDATVLVRGESGTGKELVARAVFQHSRRADEPFVVINCVAIPETLLESELFGYEKGAFTGAVTRKIGKVEQAGRGTVFLDEIGDMPLTIQAKVLRLLQERTIERLGGRAPIPVDVRIIAATNRDLETAVAEGRFREDLYYRLKVVTLELPPLREREEDIPLLAEHFLARHARALDMKNPGLTPEALDYLRGHAWPGNVRELGNAMNKALIFSRGCPIAAADVAQAVRGPAPARAAAPGPQPGPAESPVAGEGGGPADAAVRDTVRRVLAGEGPDLFERLMDGFGAVVIREALMLTGGNRSRAAKLLGLSRPTLLARMEKYGIKVGTTIS